MVLTWLTTALVAVASAFIPAIPIEPYLAGAVATTGHHPLGLGIAAGVGQTVGKLTIFLVVRGAVRSTRLRQWLDRRTTKAVAGAGSGAAAASRRRTGAMLAQMVATVRRGTPPVLARWVSGGTRSVRASAERLLALLDRPVFTAPVVFVSALIGIPPLLLTSAYAARTQIGVGTFTAVCLLGRSIRFVAIAMVPQLIMD